MVASRENLPLLAELLADQQRLQTPVARFAAAHDAGSQLSASSPQLIPLTAPAAGEHYAFEVDLDACSGCKACVSACHSLNGLDDTETWRDVGLIVGGDAQRPFQQTVTTACHHCADPACLNGCPVLAYEKDPATGIVRHLDDQCIGCSYCILKCPYDVPKFNARLGIVRKCDLCHGRLAAGEAPACAQACPTHAIRIVTVPVAEGRARPPGSPGSLAGNLLQSGGPALPSGGFLAAAPDPAYTQPTTRYRTRRRLPENLRAADADALRPQPAHGPLALMLTLLPFAAACHLLAALALAFAPPVPTSAVAAASASAATSISAFAALKSIVTYYVTIGGAVSPASEAISKTNVTYYVTIVGWVVGVAGVGASLGHLGRPGRAWRIFLGWRRSWLSREAMVFGAWMIAATVALVVPAANAAAAALGLAGLFCSAMIYSDTRRRFWRAAQTLPRFGGAVAAFAGAVALASGIATGMGAAVLMAASVAKLALEWRVVRPGARETSGRLLAGPLRGEFAVRIALAVAGGIAWPALALAEVLPAGGAWVGMAAVVAGEFLERRLFFRAVDAPKMPGMPA